MHQSMVRDERAGGVRLTGTEDEGNFDFELTLSYGVST